MTALHPTDDLSQLMGAVLSTLPRGAECEFVRLETERRSIGWAAGGSDNQGVSRSLAYGVRVLVDGGQGLVKETQLNSNNVEALVQRALLIARNTPPDPHRGLGKPFVLTESAPANDEQVFSRPVSLVQEQLRTLEANALKSSPKLKKVVRLHVEEERERKTTVNSHGVSLNAVATGSSFLVEVLAEDAAETEVAWDAVGRRFGGDINKEQIVSEAARSAVLSLGGKPLPSGLYTVLLHPRVGTQLLSLLAQALSAEAVQTGRSFLKGRLGKKAASSEITLLDDPRLPRGAASCLFDDEGTAALSLGMIEKGLLKNYFFDLRAAKREGRASNGRGFRASLSAAPSPRATNLFVAAGRHSLEALLSAEKKVFLLHDIMGLHMAEPVTGEFSLGAAGFLYENGRFSRPVRGMTLAGTVSGLLENTVAVGNEVHWTSSFGAPYLLVGGIALSGN